MYRLLFGGYARFRLLDGLTRCGRCGYPLRGVTEPRCPECGAQVGIDDRRGSRWFGGETRRSAAVIVMCLVGFLGLEFAALALDERLFPAISWRWMSAVWYPQNWGTVAALSPLSLLSLGVSLFLTLALYHALALRPRWRSGPTYCGRCGRDIGVVSEPRCPSCSSAF